MTKTALFFSPSIKIKHCKTSTRQVYSSLLPSPRRRGRRRRRRRSCFGQQSHWQKSIIFCSICYCLLSSCCCNAVIHGCGGQEGGEVGGQQEGGGHQGGGHQGGGQQWIGVEEGGNGQLRQGHQRKTIISCQYVLMWRCEGDCGSVMCVWRTTRTRRGRKRRRWSRRRTWSLVNIVTKTKGFFSCPSYHFQYLLLWPLKLVVEYGRWCGRPLESGGKGGRGGADGNDDKAEMVVKIVISLLNSNTVVTVLV